ncbi:hypothetical protein ACVM5X_000730 [Campylobacter upsaliensis]
MGMDIKLVGLIGLNEWEETFEFKNGKWQNYDFSYLLNIKNYAEISKIVDGLGPSYILLFDERELKNHKIVPNNFVKNAHKYNIKVHPYTIFQAGLSLLMSFLMLFYLRLGLMEFLRIFPIWAWNF